MNELISFYAANSEKLKSQLLEHLYLTATSVLLACALSIPLGILIAKKQKLSSTILNLTGILQTIPSIALLGFLIPVLGIGARPAIFALFLYSLLPILRNVYTGIHGIDRTVRESARGLGMNFWQILFKVELPLALPTIFAGIRTATVINVGVATLAAYIAAGGLGEFIFGGIALNNSTMILAGALPAALLAIVLDYLLSLLQKYSAAGFRKRVSLALIPFAIFLALSAFSLGSEPRLKAGYPPEFTGRDDGLLALKKTYNLQIPNVVLGSALMYQAINEEVVDVVSGYSTDGRIKAFDLKVLEDDKKAFPPYQAALLLYGQTLNRHPKLKTTLNKLHNSISDSLMTFLNYQVDEEKRDVSEIAYEFLDDHQLIGKTALRDEEPLVIGSKIFTEQYILAEIYKILIESNLGIPVETRKGLGGTKILFDALREGEIDLYPEYSGTALQVLLKMKNQPELNSAEIFKLVKENLSDQYGVKMLNPLGFNNTYAMLMRREQAEALNIQSISDLHSYLSSP